ncbi:MAG: serine/threonine-protein kinase [Cyanobacteriota bacterium]
MVTSGLRETIGIDGLLVSYSMSYCLNPDCRRPQNPIGTKFCQSCGSKLLLQERYRALQLIGQGGFGRTFLAVDENHPSKPHCVIKQFFPLGVGGVPVQGISNTQKASKLFEQEAVRLEELGTHPQIPQFLDHFEEGNRHYLVQEFIDGPNLAQVLKTEGVFSEQQIRDLLHSLLSVIEFIHAHNVIHRDIKPENIIRRTSPYQGEGSDIVRDEWVLVDFGAAKYATGTALGKTGTVIGSAGYAAPEQAGGKAVFSSDIYSLGVTCLHVLTQTEPFDLYSFSEATWVWRNYLRRPISRRVSRVLDKMVETATSRRYQSAAEVLDDLNSPVHRRIRTPRVNPPPSAVGFPQVSVQETSSSPLPKHNWRCAYTLKGHTQSIRSLAITPDGEILASGSDDKTVKLWQLATGQMICTLKGHSKSVASVAISSDGEILASGSEDKTIKLWQLTTGLQIGKLTLGNWFSGDSGCVYAIAISPDGEMLVSLSSSGEVKLWNLKSGQEIQRLRGDTSWIQAIAISPDGETLAAGSGDTIKLWNLNTGRRLRQLKGHNSWVRTVAFSPDGQTLASGSDDTTIKLWHLKTGRELCTLSGHTRSVYSLAFSPVGHDPLSDVVKPNYPDSRVEGAGVQGASDRLPLRPERNNSTSATLGELTIAASDHQASQTPLTQPLPPTQRREVRQILASSSDDLTIKLWDCMTGQELCTLTGHKSWVHTVAFSPDGKTIISGSGDNQIKIWW